VTEAEWLGCREPNRMIAYLCPRAGDRKLRLFACAACRRIRHMMGDERSRVAVEVSERCADGLADADELFGIGVLAEEAAAAAERRQSRGWNAARTAAAATGEPADAARRAAAMAADVDMVRCVFGNPFRPAALDPSWLAWNDGVVRKMAAIVYADRRYRDLPILADALEDAGCDQDDLLAHCREWGLHYRGCWAVDLLLGRT
jgi:hypothetical protein